MELCDTNVISELVRPRPNPGVLSWASEAREVAVSVITLEEIAYGLSWRPNARVEQAIRELLLDHLVVLPITVEIATRAGRVRGEQQRKGVTRTQADSLIAGTALVHRLPLVTRNTRDFEGLGIPLLNPFTE